MSSDLLDHVAHDVQLAAARKEIDALKKRIASFERKYLPSDAAPTPAPAAPKQVERHDAGPDATPILAHLGVDTVDEALQMIRAVERRDAELKAAFHRHAAAVQASAIELGAMVLRP